MGDLFGGILKPGAGGELALRRELERRRDAWDRPGYHYRGAGDFLLKHGRFYGGRDLPDQYAHLMGETSACFDNASRAALHDPSLRYVEGVYSTGQSHFTPHAWCIDAEDKVVELTYPTTDRARYSSGETGLPILDPERWGYWGVIFRPELSAWHWETFQCLGMFDRPSADARYGEAIDITELHDFPILKVPYDAGRIAL